MMSRGLSDLPVLVVANKMDLLSFPDTSDRGKLRQDIISKVRGDGKVNPGPCSDRYATQVNKSWKLNHIEVSAKYNWNISGVFRELSSELVSAPRQTSTEKASRCCLVF